MHHLVTTATDELYKTGSKYIISRYTYNLLLAGASYFIETKMYGMGLHLLIIKREKKMIDRYLVALGLPCSIIKNISMLLLL
jgi:hypothetical protein